MTKGIIFSILAHIVVLILFLLPYWFSPKRPKLDLTQAVRVDMVGLPDKPTNQMPEKPTPNQAPKPDLPDKNKQPTKPTEEKPQTKTPAKPTAEQLAKAKKEEAEIALKKTKERQQQALRRLQRQSAIDRIKDQMKSESEKQAEQQVPIKGEVLSPGTRPTGLAKMEYDLFLAQVDATIKDNWALPGWLMERGFQTRVRVRIDPYGRLLSKEIVKSSGNPTYDDFCLEAIDKSVPFPTVPDRFVDVFRVDGFVIGFPD